MLRLLALFVVVMGLIACEPSGPEGTPSPPVETLPAPTASDAPSPAITDTPGFLTASPTQDQLKGCEAVPIEYIVVVDSVRVREGPGTAFPIAGQLLRGSTFIGNLCDKVADGFIWVTIIEHPSFAGHSVALGVVGGQRYLN